MKPKYNCYHGLCLLVLIITTSYSLSAGDWTSKTSRVCHGDGCIERYKRSSTGCSRTLSTSTDMSSKGYESATPSTFSREKREAIIGHGCPKGHECVLGECVKSATMNDYDDTVDVYVETSKQDNLPSTLIPKPTKKPKLMSKLKPKPMPKTTTTPKLALPSSPPTTAVLSKNISNNHKTDSKASHLKSQLFNFVLVLVSLLLLRLC